MNYIVIILFNLFLFQNCITRYIPIFVYFDEISTIILFLLAIRHGLKEDRFKNYLNQYEKKSIQYMIIILLIGFISTIFYQIQIDPIPILKDILSISKPFICYLSCIILFNDLDKDVLLSKIVNMCKIYIIIIFILGIANIFINFGMGHDVRIGLRSYKFLYTHPTYLVFSLIIITSILIANGEEKYSNYMKMILITIILTFRSKGIAFIGIYVFFNFIKQLKVKNLIIIGAIGFVLTFKKIMLYLSWGLTAARPALYIVGAKIMMDLFPLGSGFATFASAISGEYYSPIYQKYGIDAVDGMTKYNWDYIADVFWPHIYAQYGIIGLIVFILILLNSYKGLVSRYDFNDFKINAVNILCIYVLYASTVEAIFIDITGQFAFIVLALFIGNSKNSLVNIE